MREVGVLEAKTHLSALLDAIEAGGDPVVITRHGKPVAQLNPPGNAPGATGQRKLSGEELVAKFKALQERIAKTHPETNNLTWEELREDARR